MQDRFDHWMCVMQRRLDAALAAHASAPPHRRAATAKAVSRARRNVTILEAAQASAWTTTNAMLLRGIAG